MEAQPQQQPPRQRRLTRHTLPCVLMRAGTSKGIFIHRRDLPLDTAEWAPHLISALGSRGRDPRQIDGVGGGTSTTSKAAVVAPSRRRPDADVDFTFAQVAVGREAVDFSGNCGNVLSGVGPFAVREGLVVPAPGARSVDIRVYNTNTKRIVIETVEVDEAGDFVEAGEYSIPGVGTPGSQVRCAFVDPAGSMTGGGLLPSGQKQQVLAVPHPACAGAGSEPLSARVSLVDAANPFVLVSAASVSAALGSLPSEEARHDLVEQVRRAGAAAMGLAPSPSAAARTRGTPKIALVHPPSFLEGADDDDIRAEAYSMGLPHPSLQLTGAVCVAAALSVPGTVVAELSRTKHNPHKNGDGSGGREAVIRHGEGAIRVGVVTDGVGGVRSCAVSRTARRLFEGNVCYYI